MPEAVARARTQPASAVEKVVRGGKWEVMNPIIRSENDKTKKIVQKRNERRTTAPRMNPPLLKHTSKSSNDTASFEVPLRNAHSTCTT